MPASSTEVRRIRIIQELGCGPPLVRLIQQWQTQAKHSPLEVAHTYRHCTDSLLAAICDWLVCEVSIAEAAKIAGKSERQIRRMIQQGRLTRLGGDGERLRVRLGELLCMRLR